MVLGDVRLKKIARHGFKRAIEPKANAPKRGQYPDLEVIAVDRLMGALQAAFQ